MSLVSVVIPTFDRRDMVVEAVESVLGQTFQDLELVVVDDGSRDGTAELLRERFSERRLRMIVQDNRGASAARNRGVRESDSEWVAFLDSDDAWLPGKLERQLSELRAHPDVPACYTEEIWYRRGAWANPKSVHAKHSGRIFSQCLPLCIISPSSVLLRREVFDELGGFDESLPACEDYDLWLRLSARYPVQLVRERLIVKKNGHAGQLSQAHWGLDRFRIRALWKTALDSGLSWDHRRQALETLARKAAIVAQGAEKRGQEERAKVFRYSAEQALRRLEPWGTGGSEACEPRFGPRDLFVFVARGRARRGARPKPRAVRASPAPPRHRGRGRARDRRRFPAAAGTGRAGRG